MTDISTHSSRAAAGRTLVRGALAVALALGATFGCSSPNYDPPTLIKGFRVLAVKVEPPYVGLAPSTASAFVVRATPGEERCYAWALCPFAWANEGNFECLDPRLQVDLGNDPTASFSLIDLISVLEELPKVLEEKGFNLPTGIGGEDGSTDLPDDVSADSVEDALEIKLLFQVSEARVWGGTCPRDTAKMLAKPCPTRDGCLQGHKALSVAIPNEDGSPSKAVHANPTLEMLALDGVPWPETKVPSVATYKAPPADDFSQINETQGLELLPVWSEDSIELVSKSVDPGVPDRLERLTFSFFSDAGSFQYRRTGEQEAVNGYLAEAPEGSDTQQTVTIWVVARDDRGGVDWLTRTLVVDEAANRSVHPLCGPDPSLPKCSEVSP